MLQSMGLQRLVHNLATEQQQQCIDYQFHPRHLEFISKQNGKKAFPIVLDKTTTKLRFHRVGNLRSQTELPGRATL